MSEPSSSGVRLLLHLKKKKFMPIFKMDLNDPRDPELE